ncbi:hypothetical protein QQ045_015458 [Rhodiola kirilowii]
MDGFSQCSDRLSENSSCVSDAGNSTPRSCTDEDIMLASSHPKKRTGRKKFKETRHPVYRGVRMRNSNRWVCEVREPNKRNRIWLGTYPTAEMAARAHDVAALALRGLKSCLNFADSAWRLPVPVSTNPEDIQRAAAEAAAMFSTEDDAEEADEEINVDEQSMISTIYEDAFDKNNCEGQCEELSFYGIDDEATFDMPGLLNHMAEGMLLSAPSYVDGGESQQDGNNMMLWNHSI